jgi:hypothetical protein
MIFCILFGGPFVSYHKRNKAGRENFFCFALMDGTFQEVSSLKVDNTKKRDGLHGKKTINEFQTRMVAMDVHLQFERVFFV